MPSPFATDTNPLDVTVNGFWLAYLPECLFGDRAIEVQLAESRLRYRADLPARARPWSREESAAFDRKPRPKAPRRRRVASPR